MQRPDNEERRPTTGAAPRTDGEKVSTSVSDDADTAAYVAVRRLTGCPNGCEPSHHEETCGLDWFIRERRSHHDALDRRWREHVEHEAWLRHWGAERWSA